MNLDDPNRVARGDAPYGTAARVIDAIDDVLPVNPDRYEDLCTAVERAVGPEPPRGVASIAVRVTRRDLLRLTRDAARLGVSRAELVCARVLA